ncbi:hypothetical protein HZ326_4094 [Fusarium oxysporum f. sp. albedinis]|nr:hypothetical protein HZ326_4094 [Fusarium oxysporum f. sp. albedinis]
MPDEVRSNAHMRYCILNGVCARELSWQLATLPGGNSAADEPQFIARAVWLVLFRLMLIFAQNKGCLLPHLPSSPYLLFHMLCLL